LNVYIINSITKSYILNIKIRPLVTEYALMIKLVDGTSSAHSFNPYAYCGHSWSYFDIQNLRLVILYTFCRYQIYYARHTFGITVMRYAQSRKIGKSNNVKKLESNNPKGLTRIA
jgi:hypothetical protein